MASGHLIKRGTWKRLGVGFTRSVDPSACSSPAPCDLPPVQALQPQNLSSHLELVIIAGPRVTRVMWGKV